MTRLAYALAWIAATPFILLRLLARSRKQPGYRERIAERFGFFGAVAPAPRLWIHAVSVGETRAAAPIVASLAKAWPAHEVLLTHMTPTGRATGAEIFGRSVAQAWLPYDYRRAARRFLATFRPRCGILLETEIWPNLLAECNRAGIPVVLANARLSERSARRYARFPAFTREALGRLRGIAAQTQSDARRFRELGATDVVVTGNVKFDMAVPAGMLERGREMRQRFGDRCVWVAGSTRDGEEALLLDAFARVDDARILLVVVPRHPERFGAVAELARSRGLRTARRSDEGPVSADVRVLVGDSMGEMLAYYAAADLVVMGGSLLEYGSQNLIEPCALGRPVIIGPSTYNFEEAADEAIAAGGAARVADAAAAIALALALTRDASRREAMGNHARAFVEAHRGAVDRLMAWLAATLADVPR